MKQIYQKKINPNSYVYVWEVKYSLEELLTCTPVDSKKILNLSSIKKEKRKIEILAVNFILRQLFKKDISLQYLASGKPFINESTHLSISHSHGFIAIAIGDINVGIDIERPSEKLVKLSERFLSKNEKITFDLHPSKELACKLWGSKESILKCIGDKNIDYREDINLNCSQLQIGFANGLSFRILHEEIADMMLTVVMTNDDKQSIV